MESRRAAVCLTVLATFFTLSKTNAGAPAAWTATLKPDGPLAAGACTAFRLELTGANGEAPRNPAGARISIADFDLTVAGAGVVGRYDGPGSWSACACSGAAGTEATITATYPARSLAARARVPGAAVQSKTTVAVVGGTSSGVPIGCEAAKTKTVSAGKDPVPWAVTLRFDKAAALPIGACTAIQIDLRDSTGKDVPRNPAGQRVSLADFDLTVVAEGESTVVGQRSGASSWSACVCQGSSTGARAAITATYPARALAPASQVAGVSFASSVTLPLSAAAGTSNPAVCTGGLSGGPLASAGVGTATPTPGIGAMFTATPTPTSGSGAMGGLAGGMGAVEGAGGTGAQGGILGGSGSGGTGGGSSVGGLGGSSGGMLAGGGGSGGQGGILGGSGSGTGGIGGGGGGLSGLVGSGTMPTPTPAPSGSGTYRVFVEGVHAISISHDDLLARDGAGDEVFAAVYVRRYDRRNGAILATASKRTKTYGDKKLFTTRVKAGTSTTTGGIRAGDSISNANELVWSGTLRDGEQALVLSPSLWEEDGKSDWYARWVQAMGAVDSSLLATPEIQGQITNKRAGHLLVGPTSSSARSAVTDLGVDRPIGILASGGAGDLVLPGVTVVLTREIIEAALALPPVTVPPGLSPAAEAAFLAGAQQPGIIKIPLQDGAGVDTARYELYLRAQRN